MNRLHLKSVQVSVETLANCLRVCPTGACLARHLSGSCICVSCDELASLRTFLTHFHVAHLTLPVLRFGCRLIVFGAERCLEVPPLRITRTCVVHHLPAAGALALLGNRARIADNSLEDSHDCELLVFSTDLHCLAERWC